MQAAIILLLIGSAAAAPRFVFEMLKPALTAEEVNLLKTQRDLDYPTYFEIPKTTFNCASKKQPGFYADTEARCQMFHRCDIAGNQHSYLCTNGTIFNQITLICDNFYNVDCAKSRDYEDFQNERLYTKQDLFDSPPKDMYLDTASGVLKSLALDTGVSLKNIDYGSGAGGYGSNTAAGKKTTRRTTQGPSKTTTMSAEDEGTNGETGTTAGARTTRRATTSAGKGTTRRTTAGGAAAAGGRTTARRTTQRATTTTMAPEDQGATGGDESQE